MPPADQLDKSGGVSLGVLMTLGGFLLTVGGGFAGYGSLRSDVRHVEAAQAEIRADLKDRTEKDERWRERVSKLEADVSYMRRTTDAIARKLGVIP